jgi:hypothetical protein
MALRFFDGFDHYNSGNGNSITTLMSTNGWTLNQTNACFTTSPYGVGYSCGNSTNGGSNLNYITFDNQQTWIVGFAFYAISNISANLIQLVDGGTSQLELQAIGSGATSVYFQLTRNGTLIAGPTVTYPIGTWHYLEFKGKIDPTVGVAALKVDQVTGLSFTGNTRASSNSYAATVYVNMIAYGGGSGPQMYIDDLYIADGSGTFNNDFIGQARVETLYPTGDGTTTQWTTSSGTTHYSLVNQQTPDNDSSYVSDQTVGDVDLYTVTPSLTGNTVGVNLIHLSRKDDTALRQVATTMTVGGTAYEGNTATLASGYQYYKTMYDHNPNTSVNFTNFDISSGQFGIKTKA